MACRFMVGEREQVKKKNKVGSCGVGGFRICMHSAGCGCSSSSFWSGDAGAGCRRSAVAI